MKLPTLNELPTSRSMTDVFKGYNHNLRIGDGEFYDMKNLSSSHYPILSPRRARGVYATPTNPQGLIAKDKVCYVDCITENHAEGARLYINGNEVKGLKLSSKTDDCPKQLVSMGAYIIIMPDKKWVNTQKMVGSGDGYFDYGNIDRIYSTPSGVTTTFSLCKIDSTEYDLVGTTDEPENPENMDLWLDTSSTPHALKQYSTTNAMWVTVPTTYIKISATGIGKPFEVGDGVTLSNIENEQLQDLNNTMVIQEKGDDYIVVIGIIDNETTQESPITVKRQMPNMDFVIESGNRLWGCRYGVALNGEVVNEIYASKLGDFKNWHCYAGISTDSYAATVGTDGAFTGAVTHLGYPLFFKETCVHKVYGNFPSNYQIQTTNCRGVQHGSSGSLAIVNETLFYKSARAVCAYDGSLPVEISAALGEESYYNAVAGALGNKYYISMSDANEQQHLFVFDTVKGMWHREDDTKAIGFCTSRGELFYIDSTDKKIKTVMGSFPSEVKNDIEWMAETGVIGTDHPDKKYISRIDVRMLLDINSEVRFYIQYDSIGEWIPLYTMRGTALRSFTVPIRPRRCDHLRLRIEGKGDAKIYSIAKTTEQGSAV